jgi:hypothetical protein
MTGIRLTKQHVLVRSLRISADLPADEEKSARNSRFHFDGLCPQSSLGGVWRLTRR